MQQYRVPNNSAYASLTCGLISIYLLCFGWASIASIPIGVVGILFAVYTKRRGCISRLNTAGLVTSIIGIVTGTAMLVLLCAALLLSLHAASSIAGGIWQLLS